MTCNWRKNDYVKHLEGHISCKAVLEWSTILSSDASIASFLSYILGLIFGCSGSVFPYVVALSACETSEVLFPKSCLCDYFHNYLPNHDHLCFSSGPGII